MSFILKVVHHCWAINKHFHSRLPKTVLNSIFLPFYFTEKKSDLHLAPKKFYKKRTVLKNCPKTHLEMFLIKLCGILHTHRKELSMLQ